MNRNELVAIINSHCQDFMTILLSEKLEWFMVKLLPTEDTFASVRIGKKFITVNIDTKKNCFRGRFRASGWHHHYYYIQSESQSEQT
jgi:hypothetical protein